MRISGIRKLKQKAIVHVVRERRVRWREKVMKNSGSLVEKVMTGETEGRKPRGRLRKKCSDAF